jgi:hypothetical protein
MNETTMTAKAETHAGFEPWAHHAAFPLVAGSFYLTTGVMALCLYQGWIWPLIPLVLLSSHLMHAMLIAFHEAAHGNLRKSKLLYEIDGIVHYCVANMPGAVPYTSTLALTNATLPYAIQLANKGWQKACNDNEDLKKGLNVVNGKIVYKAVADAWGLEYTPLQAVLEEKSELAVTA